MPNLGKLVVSRQGFGAMGLSNTYGQADDAASTATIHRAIDLGITLFDTATGYGDGHNERLVGEAVRSRRADVVLASKFVHRPQGGGADVEPVHPRDAVEASLKRLGVERIDLYYLHRVDPLIAIEESIGELGRLVDAGKIGAVGVSEATADGIRRAHATYPLTALQSEYSLWTRDVEVEILPTVRELGIGFVAYSPLGRGFLAGAEVSDPADRRHLHPRFQPEAVAANAQRRTTIEQVAKRLGASIAQVSLAWVLSKDVVPIPGTRHVEHLESNWAANGLVLDDQSIDALEEAFPRGATAGARYPAESLKLVPPEPVPA
ncbi:aldo/keto reductase [Sphingomonas sp. PP-CE-1G-424]|uniref:aldo/keto reductase n=1 Tax=Sphingomonas sp. PP-CE-1G-424 TaxID=2135658 RepID=UPI0010558FCB|nr:aldo/keto reductase [Sphingomonas sp. PP-CE-1G-424]TCP67443.1 aryl-alcohol dehydrogenase-like predicted oxidoreductase [Sphingomonas sp. PP-CE-1G-424]